jgi:hypothetical protein
MLSRHLLSLAVILTIGVSGVAAQPSSPDCTSVLFKQNVNEIQAARQAAAKIPESNGDTEVPPEAIKQIEQFKISLYAALKFHFACRYNPALDAPALQSALYAQLEIPVPPPPNVNAASADDAAILTGLYLRDISLAVAIIPDSRKLIAVLTTFGIPYGGDSELDIFAPGNPGVWIPAVHLRSKPYNSIYDAFSNFEYRISPPDSKGHWFTVATHINPWPTSCWQSLFVDVVRPQDLGFEYRFFHSEQYGYICDDDAPYIRSVAVNQFQFHARVTSVDESQLSSLSIMTYKIVGDDVIRVPPVALNPVNFVDEWLRSKWETAADWSAAGNLSRLRQQHERYGKLTSDDFVAYRSCATPSVTEIKLADFDGNGPSLFFLVKSSNTRFTMLQMNTRHTPSCNGPNHLESVTDR